MGGEDTGGEDAGGEDVGVRMREKGERTDYLLSSNGCVPYALTQLQTPKKRLTYHFIPFKLLGSEHFDYVTHRG